jgi:hypothetical protein
MGETSEGKGRIGKMKLKREEPHRYNHDDASMKWDLVSILVSILVSLSLSFSLWFHVHLQ